ncbi:MAG TPA: pseudouridine-5'-phosphate glycosidase [Pyrinomonadaceae bacterium]|nr:pseudouridine-5'-phosphate glycosidase [Pyrinomonadaceae bacterium]
MTDDNLIHVGDEVRAALDGGRAVVALESTVISHGLPRPLNLETARALESAVRERGAVPATVAVIKGRLRVGLDDAQLEHLATAEGVRKVSRRDLAAVVARGEDGATTVAGTLWIASRAGLKVFATGGIGGVHRGPLPDVSADLPELARTPMTVVCSGAKSVLDLPATREWLETHGVTVVGYRCDELPAFYARTSGLPLDARADTAEEAARLAAARDALGLEQALLVAVPVPAEAAPDERRLDEVLNSALSEAERRGVSGRELTPFLLSRMADASGGATLRANTALLENNARVAAEIAAALAARR